MDEQEARSTARQIAARNDSGSGRPLTIFFSAGEPSGDVHGANLIHELRKRCPQVRAVGYGGPRMQRAGCDLHVDLTAMAVMWFLRVLANLHKFWGLVSRADRYFQRERPDAVILIDYPGFNWWIARRAKAQGIPVFYYTPPQIWAWARWRVKKMRRFVDHVLCALPFETDWLNERGCNATFVGHPFFDEVHHQRLDETFLASQRATPGRLVAILPGSRTQEVTSNFKWFLQAARRVKSDVPDVRFAVAAFKDQHAALVRDMLQGSGLPVEVHVGRTPELIELAECCMSVSGSVSLELMHRATPTVILYWISRGAFRVQSYFRKVKYITLVNLLAAEDPFDERDLAPYDPSQPGAGQVPFPEYLTWEDKSAQIAAHVTRWLTDDVARDRAVRQLQDLKARFGQDGAPGRAADYILAALGESPRPLPRPHFMAADAARRGSDSPAP